MKLAHVSQDEKIRRITTEPIPGLIWQMAVPTIVSMLVTSFYNMADTFFVGRLNNQATAAVGISFSVMALIQACGFFFGHGSGNFISRKLGAREFEEAKFMSATGFFLALLAGTLLAVLGVTLITPISYALGSTATILPYTKSYLRIIFLGTPFIMGSFVLNNQLRFQGSASVAMIGIVTGAVVNIVLDPVLIFGLGLEVAGAALATVISQMLSFFLLLALSLRYAAVKIHPRNVRLNRYYLTNIAKGGFPSLCRQGIGSISTICLNTAAGLYGARLGGAVVADAAIAAMGVVTRITMFANSALIGFGQGFQPVCGTNYGAKQYHRVREAYNYCVRVGAVVLLVLAVAGFVFAKPLVLLFRDDADVVRIGIVTLRAQCIAFPLNAWIIMSNMMLQTIGMTARASVLAAARQGIFFIPLIFILPGLLGLFGVQICQMAADICSFLLALPLSRGVLKQWKPQPKSVAAK